MTDARHVALGNVASRSAKGKAMVKWTYKRVTIDVLDVLGERFEDTLNALGSEGWELVATFDRERGGNSKECFFLFKRAQS